MNSEFAHFKSNPSLESNERQRAQSGPGIAAHQVANLGMGFEQRSSPAHVGMIDSGLVETCAHFERIDSNRRQIVFQRFETLASTAKAERPGLEDTLENNLARHFRLSSAPIRERDRNFDNAQARALGAKSRFHLKCVSVRRDAAFK